MTDPSAEAVPGKASLVARVLPLLHFAWPILCLFQGSLLLGWYFVSPPAPPPGEPHERREVERKLPPIPPTESLEETERRDLRLGDAHLRQGNYAAALHHFRGPAEDVPADHLQFRVGLCQEGLRNWAEALAAYREVTARAAAAHLAAAAQVAQARVWARKGEPREVRALLWPLLLETGAPQKVTPALLAEARYLLALALSREAFPEDQFQLAGELLTRAEPAQWPVAHSLAWTTASAPPAPGARTLPDELELTTAMPATPEEMRVRGTAGQAAVVVVTARLATLTGLHLEWSGAALKSAQVRTARLACDDVPVLEILQGLLEPLGLVVFQKGEGVQIAAQTELSDKELTRQRTGAALRLLRAAVLSNPEHPLCGAACLELANAEVAAGRLADAAGWYERSLRLKERSPFLIAAAYNLGLVQSARQKYEEARQSFLRAVDLNPAHPLAPRAYVHLGRTYLQEGKIADSLLSLRRAVTVAAGSPAQALAATNLAAAQLLNGSPLEANAVLQANRAAISRSSVRPTAAFLDALARFRASKRKPTPLEAAELLAALLADTGQPALGCAGPLLHGQAYRELGMGDQMAAVYQQAAGTCAGTIAEQMAFELADYLCETTRRPEGIQQLQALAGKADSGPWVAAARRRLAAVALQDGRPQECLKQCQDLLRQGPAERSAVLQLMGRAYERLENFERAARCFAGQSPE